MKKRNNFTRFLVLLRKNNMLKRKTRPSYSLRLRVVTVNAGSGDVAPCTGVNNADRRRNFTNFNKNLLNRFTEAQQERL